MKYSAVGIGFDDELREVPHITCRGEGLVAKRILAIAERHGVPVLEKPELVEALKQLEEDEEIPNEVFEAVAVIVVELARRSPDSPPKKSDIRSTK